MSQSAEILTLIREKWDTMADVTWQERPLAIQVLPADVQRKWLDMTLDLIAKQITG